MQLKSYFAVKFIFCSEQYCLRITVFFFLELKTIKSVEENKLSPGDGYTQRTFWHVASGGEKSAMLLIFDKAEGFGMKRDYINLLYKRNLLGCEKGKQACPF